LGRIRLDSDASEASDAAINESSVLLENEDGNMVKLSFGRIRETKRPVFITPGMVVLVEGMLVPARTVPALRNKTIGMVLDVYNIYDNAAPLAALSSAGGSQLRTETEAFPMVRLIIAAGPFTLPGNLLYEPLKDVLDRGLRSRPDIFVLLGPFVDECHESIDSRLPLTFEKLFELRVMAKISAAAVDNPSTRFVVVPALADVHHHYVCPQPEFSRRNYPRNIEFLPNPASCTISNAQATHCAVIGMTSLPAVKDLSGNCICIGTRDRFGAIVSHMTRQCSFYPSFPPSPAVPLDCTQSHLLDFPEVGIDVLIVPSLLLPFVKCAEMDVLAINPGILVRGPSGGGTYAEMVIPLTRVAADPSRRVCSGSNVSGNMELLSRAEIYRL
jgi:DNA polymerase alpha/epsilon subunit B